MVTSSPRSTAVTRAVDALDVVATLGTASPTEIAERAGIAKSSVSDLITTLVAEGMLRRDSAGDCSLAAGISRIVEGAVPGYELTGDFVSVAGRVPDLEDRTVTLDALAGGFVLCLDVRLGKDPLSLTPRAGLTRGICESAPGLAILRTLSGDQLLQHAERFRGQGGLTPEDVPALIETHRLEREAVSSRSADLTVRRPEGRTDIDISHPIAHARDAGARVAVTARVSARTTASERRRIERGVRRLAELLPA